MILQTTWRSCDGTSRSIAPVATAVDGDQAVAMVAGLQARPRVPRHHDAEARRDRCGPANQSDDSLGFIPVILLTARADVHSVFEALDAGGDDYLTKPFDGTALLARAHARRCGRRPCTTSSAPKVGSRRAGARAVGLEPDLGAQGRRASAADRANGAPAAPCHRRWREQLISSPNAEKDLLESHRREVTVVFCDLADSRG